MCCNYKESRKTFLFTFRVSDTSRNGDVLLSVCVAAFVFEESGVLQLKRAEGGEACTTVVQLVHLQKAFGISVTEVIVSAATLSVSITFLRKENLHLVFQHGCKSLVV